MGSGLNPTILAYYVLFKCYPNGTKRFPKNSQEKKNIFDVFFNLLKFVLIFTTVYRQPKSYILNLREEILHARDQEKWLICGFYPKW